MTLLCTAGHLGLWMVDLDPIKHEFAHAKQNITQKTMNFTNPVPLFSKNYTEAIEESFVILTPSHKYLHPASTCLVPISCLGSNKYNSHMQHKEI